MGILSLFLIFSFVNCAPSPSESEAKQNGGQSVASSPESPAPLLPSAPTPPPDAWGVLSFRGSGGVVNIGDSLDIAKKAMPPMKGAREGGAVSFLVFGTEGWSWFMEDSSASFEVMLRGGKIDGIAYTESGKQLEVYRRRVKGTIKHIGEPTRHAKGKSSEVYVWQRGDYARLEVIAEMAPNNFFYLCFIAREPDLKVLNYRPDDPQTLVMQMDLGAERAREQLSQSQGAGQKR